MRINRIGTSKKEETSRENDAGLDLYGLVEAFIQLQFQRGVVEATLNCHLNALNKMFRTEPNLHALENKLLRCLPRTDTNSYYNKKLNTYRMFFDYLINEGILDSNPALKWKYKKPAIKIAEHSVNDIQVFLKQFDRDTFSGFRDYLASMIILDCGVRPSELLQVELPDIDELSCEINLRREITKTRDFRRVPISMTVMKMIKQMISYRPEEWSKNFLICTATGDKMPTHALAGRFRLACKNIDVKITPYQLRHIFATNYIRDGGDGFSLQRILGHSSSEMTKIYVNLNIGDLHDKHKQFVNVNRYTRKTIRKLE